MALQADVKQDKILVGAVSGRLDCAECPAAGRRRGEVWEANAYRETGRMRTVDGAVFFPISGCEFGGDKTGVAAPFSGRRSSAA